MCKQLRSNYDDWGENEKNILYSREGSSNEDASCYDDASSVGNELSGNALQSFFEVQGMIPGTPYGGGLPSRPPNHVILDETLLQPATDSNFDEIEVSVQHRRKSFSFAFCFSYLLCFVFTDVCYRRAFRTCSMMLCWVLSVSRLRQKHQ